MTGAEVLLEHLAFGVEEAYLFADEASDDEAWLDAGEASGLANEGAVAQDGLLQGRPFGAVHPGDDVASLLLRHFLQGVAEECAQFVEFGVLAHVDLGGLDHAVHRQGVVAVLRGVEDEACVDGIVACQGGEARVAQRPFGIDLLLRQLGILQPFDFRHRQQGTVVLVHRAAVVGHSELIKPPGADDGGACQGEKEGCDVQCLAPPGTLAPQPPCYAKSLNHATCSKRVTSIRMNTMAPAT